MLLLTLRWDDARAALPLDSVVEVLRLGGEGGAELVPVPKARVSVQGVLMHRGYVVPVFDPRRWKGFFSSLPANPDDYIVLVQSDDSLDGVVAGAVDVAPEAEDAPPAPGGASPGIGAAFAEREARTRRADGASEAWTLLSLPRLAKAMHGE